MPNGTLPELICSEARNLIQAKALRSGNRTFRQWVLGCEQQEVFKSHVNAEVRAGMLAGKSAQRIADDLYRAHSGENQNA